jgi:acetoin utilization protein AcuB
MKARNVMRLKEIMSIPVEVIGPDTSVADARARMARARIHHLVVASGRDIIGIVSERDLDGAAPEAAVQPLMSSPVITAPADTTVADAAKLLRGHDIGCLPVMERGRPIGMVTIVDLLTLLGKGALHVNPETGRRVLSRRGPMPAH